MAPSTDTRPKLAWIQALRGVAVLFVVLTHARYYFLDTPTWPLAEQLLRPGAMGVDLFFVISGFIMVYTTRHVAGTPRDAFDFLVRRFARIWPLYAVITLAWLTVAHSGFGWLTNWPPFKALLLSLSFQPVDIENPLYFSASLPLGWTLNFEMYFYVVFGLCLLAGRRRWLLLAGWILFTVLVIPALKRDLTLDVLTNFRFSIAYLNLVTNPIILEFLAGVAIGWLYLQDWFALRSQTVARHLVFLALALAAWASWGTLVNFHGPKQWGAVVALMVLALALASKTIELAPPRVLVWLGTISFSLYLTHTTTQLLATRAVEAIGGDTHGWSHVLLTTALAISVAAAVYHYLEQRLSDLTATALRRLGSRLGSRPAGGTALDPRR
ncbi:acyltransferase [Massilia sp. G4R7]|uniref:Acyltransferase n=1 Tax=Massilia phyllostachyos TaxID=2898585 RepID=A0ABS8Q7L3_9BURK|nr:acyltransferase [Massilia phyllostachyos]MCD2517738.1 acyltransferase [Massilia phyllostachyos]